MHFKMSSAICFNLDQSKILSSGNGLRTGVVNPIQAAWPDWSDLDLHLHGVTI